MVGEITDRLFQGSAVALVSHLLEEHGVKPEELQELQDLIAKHEEGDDS